MDLGLRGKVALVTGASRGIGKAIAKRSSEEGCRVAICARDAERLARGRRANFHMAQAQIVRHRRAHRRHRRSRRDRVRRRRRTRRSAASTSWSTTPARICAARSTPRRSDILERQLRDKVFGFFAMIQAVLPIMQRQKDGRIVNIVGQAARHPHPDRFPSGVTNAAVMALTKSVADAVARDNIRVNAVCPQYIESELLASLIDEGDARAQRRPRHRSRRLHARQSAGPHRHAGRGRRPGVVPGVRLRQLHHRQLGQHRRRLSPLRVRVRSSMDLGLTDKVGAGHRRHQRHRPRHRATARRGRLQGRDLPAATQAKLDAAAASWIPPARAASPPTCASRPMSPPRRRRHQARSAASISWSAMPARTCRAASKTSRPTRCCGISRPRSSAPGSLAKSRRAAHAQARRRPLHRHHRPGRQGAAGQRHRLHHQQRGAACLREIAVGRSRARTRSSSTPCARAASRAR